MSAIHGADGTLLDLLDRVDDQKLRRVIELIEASGQRPVLEPALAALRPRLRSLRPRRPLTLIRLVTAPFALALVDDASPHAFAAVRRGHLPRWQAAALDPLDPALATMVRELAATPGDDEHQAMLAAGRRLWPAAATALTTMAPAGEPAEDRLERLRVADCLALGGTLLPLLDRLLPIPALPDAEDRETLQAILAIAAEGPPDRLAIVAAMLLRAASRPWSLAAQLLELAPGALQGALRRVLERLLVAHRLDLERCLERQAEADTPIADYATAIERLAAALTLPEGTAQRPLGRDDPSPLRRPAAAMAMTRFAAALDGLLLPLPPPGAPARAAAQRAREAEARALSRLGRAVRRLAPDGGIERLIEEAVERLVDAGAARGKGRQLPVGIEDARLIEILAGPDIAWHYLRPHAGPAGPGALARRPPPAGRR
jgi:hypothetical protein